MTEKNASTLPAVIPMNSPELKASLGLRGTYKEWMKRSADATKEGNEDAAIYCERRAYFSSDDLGESFYQFVKNIIMVGFADSQLDDNNHMKMARFIASTKKRRMMLVSRGSFKSTMGALGYATWRLAKEYFETGESRLRVLFASENMTVAERNMMFVKQMMEWSPEYCRLAGTHRGTERGRQAWGIKALTSCFREEAALGEPSASPIGVKAGRTGFHYDIIICDDLQAESYAMTVEQIDAVDRFYKLLHSMLIQDDTGEFLIIGTRWHKDDIYKRIEDRNEAFKKQNLHRRMTDVLIIPVRDKKTGSINFPKIYTESLLEEIRLTQGSRIYANQYLLEPVDDEEQVLKHEFVQYWVRDMLVGRKLNVYITCDLAFTEISKSYRDTTHDYTVIMKVGIDEDWNYFILDCYRQKCSKLTAIKEIYRQFHDPPLMQGMLTGKPIAVLMQKFDRAQVKETIDQYARLNGKYLPFQWIGYPPKTKKAARIESSVVPQFEALRVFLPPNLQWFLNEEFYDFPGGKYDDALDALCNVTWYSNPAIQRKERPKLNKWQRMTANLKAGRGRHGEGGRSWKNM